MSVDEKISAGRAQLVAALTDIQAALRTERSRRRAGLVRQRHELRRMIDDGYIYSSQAGQDWVIDLGMAGAEGGTFVDVGGYDGVRGSNTLFLEQQRGWTGLLVEPVPAQRLRAERARKCPCLPFAVGPENGTAQFIAVTEGFTQMSGLADSYDPGLLMQVRGDPRHKEELVTVETRTLSSILADNNLMNPDFISLDIEGGEKSVLRSFPFDRHRVQFWAIENNTTDPEIGQIMRANGYTLIEFCGPDDVYRLAT